MGLRDDSGHDALIIAKEKDAKRDEDAGKIAVFMRKYEGGLGCH